LYLLNLLFHPHLTLPVACDDETDALRHSVTFGARSEMGREAFLAASPAKAPTAAVTCPWSGRQNQTTNFNMPGRS
jgi:hypothetical protein